MKIGFLGTGEISKAVILGLLKSKIKYSKIYISRRNKKNSTYLSSLNKKIIVLNENQKIINNSDWIFLSVTPDVGCKILKKLKFKKSQTIISFISTIKMRDLKKFIKVKAKIFRAIPLPPISLMKGPIPIYPPNKKIRIFFDKIGDSIEIKNEDLSLNFWAISSLMAPYYQLLDSSSKWLQNRGLEKKASQKYITSLFSSLSDFANLYAKKDLNLLVKSSQTPKGLNEQTLKFLKKSGFYKNLNNSLNLILKRLK